MAGPSAERSKHARPLTSVPDFAERNTDNILGPKQYDPHIPEEAVLRELEKETPDTAEDAANHAEAFGSTPGEELRPKDGTLDGGSAR